MISQEQAEVDALSIANAKQKARQQLRKLRKKCNVGDVISPLNEKWKAKK